MFSKRIIRILALCIAAVFLMACIPMSAAQTSEAETSYKRKIISVVYDNSGSMEVQSRIIMRSILFRYCFQCSAAATF